MFWRSAQESAGLFFLLYTSMFFSDNTKVMGYVDKTNPKSEKYSPLNLTMAIFEVQKEKLPDKDFLKTANFS